MFLADVYPNFMSVLAIRKAGDVLTALVEVFITPSFEANRQ